MQIDQTQYAKRIIDKKPMMKYLIPYMYVRVMLPGVPVQIRLARPTVHWELSNEPAQCKLNVPGIKQCICI